MSDLILTDKQGNNSKKLPRGKPWLPGESGNPDGRPRKDACLTSLLKDLLDQKADYIAPGSLPSDKTWRDMLIKALLTKASSGDVKALELILDRCEGKVSTTVDLGGDVIINLVPAKREDAIQE